MFIALHSIFRYVVLLTTLIVFVQSLMGMMGKKEFTPGNRKGALFMMISCDIQLLLGLVVYMMGGFASGLGNGGMANHYSRFYGMEHPLSMVIAIVLVHVGYSAAKKNTGSDRKFKVLFWCSLLALLIFLAMTPWAGRADIGKPMFPSFG